MTLRRFAVFLLVLLPVTLFAKDVPPPPQAFVYDSANLLSQLIENRLELALRQVEKKSSNQIVVATFPSLDGDDLESFTTRVFSTWRPGTADRDNGVILFVFKDDRELRIEVGYGLEATLTDALSKRIIENEIISHFKNGDFEGGITAGVAAIVSATEGTYTATPKPGKLRRGLSDILKLLVIAFFLLVFRLPWLSWYGFTLGGSGHGRGGGFGGGFGGFGGGLGGGGGASGRW